MFIINYNYKVVSTSFFIFLLSHPQSSVFSRSTLVEKIPLQRSLGETGVVLGILYPESMRLCHSFIYLLEVLLQVLIDLRLSKRLFACAFVFQSSFRPCNYTQSIKLVSYQSYQIFTHEEHINIYSKLSIPQILLYCFSIVSQY